MTFEVRIKADRAALKPALATDAFAKRLMNICEPEPQ